MSGSQSTPGPPIPKPSNVSPTSSFFRTRALSFKFDLLKNSAGDPHTFAGSGGSSSVYISDHRASVTINKSGQFGTGLASITIYGMTMNIMASLSTYSQYKETIGNSQVTILAGDEQGMAIVFQGTIVLASINAAGQPDVAFEITAQAGGQFLTAAAPSTSYDGAADAATVIKSIVDQMGFTFENNGVSQIINDAHYSGTLKDQLERVAADAGCEYSIDLDTVAIWPKDGVRATSGKIPQFDLNSGLVNYPTFNNNSTNVRILFDPNVIAFGRTIKINSELPNATGNWKIMNITLILECQTVDGAWFSDIECVNPDKILSRAT